MNPNRVFDGLVSWLRERSQKSRRASVRSLRVRGFNEQADRLERVADAVDLKWEEELARRQHVRFVNGRFCPLVVGQ